MRTMRCGDVEFPVVLDANVPRGVVYLIAHTQGPPPRVQVAKLVDIVGEPSNRKSKIADRELP